jgi:hypothetical protein
LNKSLPKSLFIRNSDVYVDDLCFDDIHFGDLFFSIMFFSAMRLTFHIIY